MYVVVCYYGKTSFSSYRVFTVEQHSEALKFFHKWEREVSGQTQTLVTMLYAESLEAAKKTHSSLFGTINAKSLTSACKVIAHST